MANFIHVGGEALYSEGVSNVTLTNSVLPGMRRCDENGNDYIYAFNAGNQQISQGIAAVLASACSGYSVTVSATAQLDIGIGVCRNATMATAAYGWLMTNGFGPISTDNTSGVTNQVFVIGLNGALQVLTSVVGSFVTGTIVGKLNTSVATGATATNAAYFNFR